MMSTIEAAQSGVWACFKIWNSKDTYSSVQGYFGFTSAGHLVFVDGASLVCTRYVGELIVADLFAIYSLLKQFL